MNGRQSLSERLTNLGDSKSYMYLGRGSDAGTSRMKGVGGYHKSTSSSMITNTIHTTNLMRDDFLIFELIVHSQGDENEDGNLANLQTKIKGPLDYSVVYHNWTLRQLYRHVVASTKIQNSATIAGSSTNATDSTNTAHKRSRSTSISGDNFLSPIPKQQHHTRNTSTGSSSTSRHHRRHSSKDQNSSNHPASHHHHHQPKLLGSNLHPRDMRRLVTPFSASNEPELIVRRHVMVFNFDPLRAIITRDRLLVLVPNGADSILKNLEERIVGSSFEYDGYDEEETEHVDITQDEDEDEDDGSALFLQTKPLHPLNDVENGVVLEEEIEFNSSKEAEIHGNVAENEDGDEDDADGWSDMMMMEMEGQQHDDLTFELLCVNACLSTVFEMLADDTRELQDKGLTCIQDRVIGGANHSKKQQQPLKPEDALAVIRNLKNAVKVMQARVKGFVHSINRILNEDEDMALMNLSRLISHPENFVQPISQELLEIESDEPELVLESNLHNALTLSNALDLIEGQVDTARYVCHCRD